MLLGVALLALIISVYLYITYVSPDETINNREMKYLTYGLGSGALLSLAVFVMMNRSSASE